MGFGGKIDQPATIKYPDKKIIPPETNRNYYFILVPLMNTSKKKNDLAHQSFINEL